MYFVDRNKMEAILNYMETCLSLFESESFGPELKEQLLLERVAHIVIESMLDIGNNMIDGFIMRDPGSYEDIIDILEDEKVVPSPNAAELKNVIALRKNIIQSYTKVEHAKVNRILSESVSSLKAFPDQIRTYLTEELGPISAFLPNEKD